MHNYLKANQKRWEKLAAEHEQSPFYDLVGFKAGKERLRSIELSELGDVAGKTLLHLQGQDGWWRLPPHQHGTIPFLFSLQARKPA